MSCAFPSISVEKAVGDRFEIELTLDANWPTVGTGLTGYVARGGVAAAPGDTEFLLDLTTAAEPISIAGQSIRVVLTGDQDGDGQGETRRLGPGRYVIGVRVVNGSDVRAVAQINLTLVGFPSK